MSALLHRPPFLFTHPHTLSAPSQAAKVGYSVQFVEPAKTSEEGGDAQPGGLNLKAWNLFLEREKNRKPESGGCTIS